MVEEWPVGTHQIEIFFALTDDVYDTTADVTFPAGESRQYFTVVVEENNAETLSGPFVGLSEVEEVNLAAGDEDRGDLFEVLPSGGLLIHGGGEGSEGFYNLSYGLGSSMAVFVKYRTSPDAVAGLVWRTDTAWWEDGFRAFGFYRDGNEKWTAYDIDSEPFDNELMPDHPDQWHDLFLVVDLDAGFIIREESTSGIFTYTEGPEDWFFQGDGFLQVWASQGEIEIDQVILFTYDSLDLN